jgi:hypothetical protein
MKWAAGIEYTGETGNIIFSGSLNDPTKPDYTPALLEKFLRSDEAKGSILFTNYE